MNVLNLSFTQDAICEQEREFYGMMFDKIINTIVKCGTKDKNGEYSLNVNLQLGCCLFLYTAANYDGNVYFRYADSSYEDEDNEPQSLGDTDISTMAHIIADIYDPTTEFVS